LNYIVLLHICRFGFSCRYFREPCECSFVQVSSVQGLQCASGGRLSTVQVSSVQYRVRSAPVGAASAWYKFRLYSTGSAVRQCGPPLAFLIWEHRCAFGPALAVYCAICLIFDAFLKHIYVFLLCLHFESSGPYMKFLFEKNLYIQSRLVDIGVV
jgi:hypothetical protein